MRFFLLNSHLKWGGVMIRTCCTVTRPRGFQGECGRSNGPGQGEGVRAWRGARSQGGQTGLVHSRLYKSW